MALAVQSYTKAKLNPDILPIYNARKMLGVENKDLQTRLSGNFKLLFDDGVTLVTNAQETKYSSFVWDILREFPHAPLTSRFHLNSLLATKPLNAGTLNELCSRVIFEGVIDTYTAKGLEFDDDRLGELYYIKTNELYNYSVNFLRPFMTSLDIMSYYKLLNYPPMKALLDSVDGTEETIAEGYKSFTKMVMEDPNIQDNEVCISARSGLVRMNQLQQCLFLRGFATDIDSLVFGEAAMGNFAQGYADFYSLFIDSRTAAKALYYSARLLRNTEYKSRKMQILDMSVETIHRYDCGSDKYIHWLIRDTERDDNGKVTRKADARYWLGKYFLDEELGKVREFRKEDEGTYIGKILKFRSPLAGCKVQDDHGVCYVCWSSQGRLIPKHTNIGHAVAAALMQILSQSILSVKHIDASSSSSRIALSAIMQEYFTTTADGKSYMFTPSLAGKQKILYFLPEEVSNLATISTTSDMSNLALDQISQITNATLVTDVGIAAGLPTPVGFVQEKRKAFFTADALAYIKMKGWMTEEARVRIDFSDWPMDAPVMTLPQRHYNMADHADAITRLIQGRNDDNSTHKNDGSPFNYFEQLYELVNSRLDVDAAILEMIIYGASIRDGDIGDYRLPKYGTSSQMGVTSTTVPGRSTGLTISFEYHKRNIFSAQGFNPTFASDEVFDVTIKPQETVKDRHKRGLR